MVCSALLRLGLALVGCPDFDTTSKAGAAQGNRIQTFAIEAGSFELITDDEPTIDIFDGAAQYTLDESDERVSFTILGGAEKTINLELGDIVIERPSAGAVTVIFLD